VVSAVLPLVASAVLPLVASAVLPLVASAVLPLVADSVRLHQPSAVLPLVADSVRLHQPSAVLPLVVSAVLPLVASAVLPLAASAVLPLATLPVGLAPDPPHKRILCLFHGGLPPRPQRMHQAPPRLARAHHSLSSLRLPWPPPRRLRLYRRLRVPPNPR